MNREQLVEKVAEALWGQVEAGSWTEGDAEDKRECRGVAEVILDAILPQVTTVEDLAALPDGTLLLSERDHKIVERRWDTTWRAGGFDYEAAGVIEAFGPLTVVWQP